LEVQEWRLKFLGPHVRPNGAATVYRRVSSDFDFVFEVTLSGLGRHINAIAGDVKLPSVIDASQAALFVPAKEQTRPAMRAIIVNKTYITVGVSEGH
jgi:hypothetical protein